MDGSPLMDEIEVLQTALQNVTPEGTAGEGSRSQFSWSTVLIGALLGIIVCLAAFTFKLVLFPDADDSDDRRSSARERSSRPVLTQVASTQKREPAAATEAEATPSEEPEDPDAEPSPSPDTSTQTVASRLNSGPVSTGARRDGEHGQTLIKLKDGSSVTADTAWEDSQGVWYRRGGLVSFVDRDQVEAITDVGQPQASTGTNPGP